MLSKAEAAHLSHEDLDCDEWSARFASEVELGKGSLGVLGGDGKSHRPTPIIRPDSLLPAARLRIDPLRPR